MSNNEKNEIKLKVRESVIKHYFLDEMTIETNPSWDVFTKLVYYEGSCIAVYSMTNMHSMSVMGANNVVKDFFRTPKEEKEYLIKKINEFNGGNKFWPA